MKHIKTIRDGYAVGCGCNALGTTCGEWSTKSNFAESCKTSITLGTNFNEEKCSAKIINR